MNNHLILGGTGRAGTTFLVQYLTACGFETHLTKHPTDRLDEHANAGLEDLPIEGADLPYVIKTPWLYEFVDRLLDRKDVVIDAVLLPMRDIVEAASSRVTLELRSRFGHPALDEEHTRWETWGTTPGGMVYSLNPVDQARILAMGFHQVVYAFVKKQIPIVFLDFPRLVEDGEYLYEQLRPVFGNSVTREQAIAAHKRSARKDFVRVGAELEGKEGCAGSSPVPIKFPSFSDIDRAALFRELKNAKRDADLHQARCRELEDALRNAESASTKTITQLQNALRDGVVRYQELEEELRNAELASAKTIGQLQEALHREQSATSIKIAT